MLVSSKASIPVRSASQGVKDGPLPEAILAFLEPVEPEVAHLASAGERRTGPFVLDAKGACRGVAPRGCRRVPAVRSQGLEGLRPGAEGRQPTCPR
jgi:hypothetical protein